MEEKMVLSGFWTDFGKIGITLATMQVGTIGIQLGINLRKYERFSLLKLIFWSISLCIDVTVIYIYICVILA